MRSFLLGMAVLLASSLPLIASGTLIGYFVSTGVALTPAGGYAADLTVGQVQSSSDSWDCSAHFAGLLAPLHVQTVSFAYSTVTGFSPRDDVLVEYTQAFDCTVLPGIKASSSQQLAVRVSQFKFDVQWTAMTELLDISAAALDLRTHYSGSVGMEYYLSRPPNDQNDASTGMNAAIGGSIGFPSFTPHAWLAISSQATNADVLLKTELIPELSVQACAGVTLGEITVNGKVQLALAPFQITELTGTISTTWRTVSVSVGAERSASGTTWRFRAKYVL